MDGFRFELSCPLCGDPVVYHRDGEQRPGISTGKIRCEPCMTVFEVVATVRAVGRWRQE